MMLKLKTEHLKCLADYFGLFYIQQRFILKKGLFNVTVKEPETRNRLIQMKFLFQRFSRFQRNWLRITETLTTAVKIIFVGLKSSFSASTCWKTKNSGNLKGLLY